MMNQHHHHHQKLSQTLLKFYWSGTHLFIHVHVLDCVVKHDSLSQKSNKVFLDLFINHSCDHDMDIDIYIQIGIIYLIKKYYLYNYSSVLTLVDIPHSVPHDLIYNMVPHFFILHYKKGSNTIQIERNSQ